MEIGAGSGAYLNSFLDKHKKWQAIFCDLEDVIIKAKDNHYFQEDSKKVRYFPCNLLDTKLDFRETDLTQKNIDIILLSNFIHCQGRKETREIIAKITHLISADKTIIIHVFFQGYILAGISTTSI